MSASGPLQVAVVIPCFNSRDTVGAAIESATAQENVDEVIIVDDGSTDDSAAVASHHGGSVIVLSGGNAGISVARNRGIEATRAPLIQFLDADDILLPGTIAARVQALAASGDDVVVTDWQEFSEQGASRSVGPVRSAPFADLAADAELACMTRFWAPPAAILYSRAIVERAGRFRSDYRTLEDARFLFDVARAKARFRHSLHPGALYRVHPGSKSRSDPTGFWTTVIRKALDAETTWRAEGAFDATRSARLSEAYNGALAGLFQVAAAEFLKAARTVDELGVRLTMRNRLARTITGILGHSAARRIARAYSGLRAHGRSVLASRGPGAR